jgi:hypothetical protein
MRKKTHLHLLSPTHTSSSDQKRNPEKPIQPPFPAWQQAYDQSKRWPSSSSARTLASRSALWTPGCRTSPMSTTRQERTLSAAATPAGASHVGTLRDGSNVGTSASFFSSTAVAATEFLPGLHDAFRPRVADTDLVLLPADLGSESPPPDAGDSHPLELDPDIATESPNSPPKPPLPSRA